MIAVVDYGAGNLHSVCSALDLFGQSYEIASEPAKLDGVKAILLPGVGHFGQMMRALDDLALTGRLKEEAERGTPILGICLGMQAMFEASAEAPGLPGLGFFPGKVERFVGVPRIPHMGWNDVVEHDGTSRDYYFANSFYAPIGSWTAGSCEYAGVEFSAIMRRRNVSGFQFHPEKSGEAGLKLLREWCESC